MDHFNYEQQRGLLLRARPGVFALLFGLCKLFSGWPLFALFVLFVALALVAFFGQPEILSSVLSSEGLSVVLKSHDEATELAMAS